MSDKYSKTKAMYRIIYSKIREWSCRPLSFNEFIEKTAYVDYDTLLFGLYSATYPDEQEYDLDCQHCGATNKITVTPQKLVSNQSEAIFGAIGAQINKEWENPGQGEPIGDLAKKTELVKLPDSGYIVRFQNPSISAFLSTTQKLNELFRTKKDVELNAGMELIGGNCMTIKELYMPDGKGGFFKVDNFNNILDQIKKLSPKTDCKLLATYPNLMTKDLIIEYSIPGYTCPHCTAKNADIPMDFESTLLFKSREIMVG